MNENKFLVCIEKQSDGTYIAYNKENVSTAIGTGETVADAKDDFFNTLSELRELAIENNSTIPGICNMEPEFKFDVSSLFEYFSVINKTAFANMIGINASLLRQYKKGGTYISSSQLEKIEKGINQLGHELAKVRLV